MHNYAHLTGCVWLIACSLVLTNECHQYVIFIALVYIKLYLINCGGVNIIIVNLLKCINDKKLYGDQYNMCLLNCEW